MPTIQYLEQHIVYENPRPHVRSRHAYFPGVIQLASGELLALFVMGEAFEAANLQTYVARSSDLGRTWQLQGPLYDPSGQPVPTTDCLKPQLLPDGRVIALGYRFYRHDAEAPIADPKTEGVLAGDDIVSFSSDDGKTWSTPRVIPRAIPELLEIPSRSCVLRNGDIVATAGLFRMPDGSNPSGQFGVLLRSTDGGQTWDDGVHFFQTPGRTISAYESHICEMQDGRLVAVCWAMDVVSGTHYPNQVTVSHDNGYTWSKPIDTGHWGQAANLLYLGDEYLMSIHCHRARDAGLYTRIVDFSNDQWNVVEEQLIWGNTVNQQTHDGQRFPDLAKSLRFGQASLLPLNNGEILATHWAVEDGQGRIRTHRLRVDGLELKADARPRARVAPESE